METQSARDVNLTIHTHLVPSYSSTPPYVLMACCLGQQKVNFTFSREGISQMSHTIGDVYINNELETLPTAVVLWDKTSLLT
jgi:hypothetical protein